MKITLDPYRLMALSNTMISGGSLNREIFTKIKTGFATGTKKV
jgi:hypothetical protein